MNAEMAAVLVGSGVTVLLALGGIIYTAGRFSSALENLSKQVESYKDTFKGFHRRFSEQDAALDSIREDVSAMRMELELKGTLRQKTNA